MRNQPKFLPLILWTLALSPSAFATGGGKIIDRDHPSVSISLRCSDSRCLTYQFVEVVANRATVLNQKEYTKTELHFAVTETLRNSVDTEYRNLSSYPAPEDPGVMFVGLFVNLTHLVECGATDAYLAISNSVIRSKIKRGLAEDSQASLTHLNYRLVKAAIEKL